MDQALILLNLPYNMFDERKTNEGISQAKSTDSKAND